MAISPGSIERGCASNFSQPVNEEDERQAQCLAETVHYYNCRVGASPLLEILYRSSSGDYDMIHHVFRWDLAHYSVVFRDGFRARPQQDTPEEVYFNLDHHVHHGGWPVDSTRLTTHVFVSTTLNSGWYPSLRRGTNESIEIYRYEIYAPGGILVNQTLGDRYRYRRQDEISFAAGIDGQYIRSAQHFRLTANTSFTRRERVNNVLIINSYFNIQSDPQRFLNIRRPIHDYRGENGSTLALEIINYPHDAALQREKRQVSTDRYAASVANFESYINAAFRSSRANEAYLFMMNEYVLLDTTKDKVVNGPLLICAGYPSLTGTAFAEHGIDCAFGSHDRDEAFIFSGNLCAQINFEPGTTNDKIIKGPMTITAMFPFFKTTVFESGVDAAFEATKRYEAYLFKGNQYALINYGSDSQLIARRPITEGFASLENTIFESGIDAAFASHETDQAYLFKGDSYALINFAPGTTDDYIIGGVKKIIPNWPSLASILPRENRGLDVHDHTKPDADRAGHDEL